MSKTGTFKVYKNTGAAQFSILPPTRNDKGFISKDGAVLVEVCQCHGKGPDGNIKTDWDNKLNFAINMADLCNLLDENTKKHRLYHQFKGNTKTLEFTPGEGQYAGTFMLQLSQGQGDSRRRVSVPLTNGEYKMIMRLLIGAGAPSIIGW